MVELRVLGGLQLRDSSDGHEILSVLARAKPCALLVYLALSRSNVSHGPAVTNAPDVSIRLAFRCSSNRSKASAR